MENSKVKSLVNYRLKAIDLSRESGISSSITLVAPKPKLLDQVRQAIRTRHYGYMTEKAYIGWIKGFIFFHNKRHPAEMGEAEIAQFLSALAQDKHVSASTQNQALNALLFLYHEVLQKEIGYIKRCRSGEKADQIAGCVEPPRSEIGFISALRYGVGYGYTTLWSWPSFDGVHAS